MYRFSAEEGASFSPDSVVYGVFIPFGRLSDIPTAIEKKVVNGTSLFAAANRPHDNAAVAA